MIYPVEFNTVVYKTNTEEIEKAERLGLTPPVNEDPEEYLKCGVVDLSRVVTIEDNFMDCFGKTHNAVTLILKEPIEKTSAFLIDYKDFKKIYNKYLEWNCDSENSRDIIGIMNFKKLLEQIENENNTKSIE